MRINKRLIKSHYGIACINRNYRMIAEAGERMIEDINRAFIRAVEEGKIQLFEREDGTITSPLIHLDLKNNTMNWENVHPGVNEGKL